MKFQHIVVPVDFRRNTQAVLPFIEQLANVRRPTLHLLHAVEPVWLAYGGGAPAEFPLYDRMVDAAYRRLEKEIPAATARRFGVTIEPHVAVGAPSGVVLDYARRRSAHLIAMSLSSASPTRRAFSLGGFAGKVLAAARRPGLVVPQNPSRGKVSIKRIMCPTDFSPAAHKAFKTAFALAQTLGAELHVVHVPPKISRQRVDDKELAWAVRRVENLLRNRTEKALEGITAGSEAVRIQCQVMPGDAVYKAIASYARKKDIDLVVMGTTGESTLPKQLFGSNTERVAWLAPCPVLAVPK